MVKLKTRMVMTYNLEDLEREEEYGRIEKLVLAAMNCSFPLS